MSQSCSQTTVFGRLTLQWVVETGRPMLEATTTVRAEASSILKPLWREEKQHSWLWACLLNWNTGNVYGGCGFMTKDKQVLYCLESVPWGGDWGKVPAHSLDHSATPHPESSTDAHATVQEKPQRCGQVWSHTAGLVNQPQSYQWSNGITAEERMTLQWLKILHCDKWKCDQQHANET